MAPLTTQAQAATSHHDAVLAAIDELRDRGGELLEVLRDARPQSEREVEDALAEHGLGAGCSRSRARASPTTTRAARTSRVAARGRSSRPPR
jgi:hypothetical protein